MELAHRLVNTRSGTAMLALVAAVGAGVAVLVYVSHYRSTVNADASPVTVLVARQPIAKGTAGEVILAQSLFASQQVRGDEAATGAILDVSALRNKVATRDIAAGEQLTTAAMGSGVSTMSTKLTGDQRAIGIPIDTARGLIGKIETGDHVDVLAGFNVQGALTGAGRPVVTVIAQNVPVLGISSLTKSGTTSATSQSSTVMLRVSDAQGAKLAFASDNGKVWLVLRPRAGAPATTPSIVSVDTLLGAPRLTTGGK